MTFTNTTTDTARRQIFELQRKRDGYQTSLNNAKAAGRKAGAKAMRWAIRDCNARIDALYAVLQGG